MHNRSFRFVEGGAVLCVPARCWKEAHKVRFLCFDQIRKSCSGVRRKPFLLLAFVGGSRLDAAGSFVPTNTKQALSNMLQRRSGAMMQPPSLHAITSQQQLIQMKLLQQQQQQRLLRQAQTRPFQQVCPDQQCLPHFISSSSKEWVWACDWLLLPGHPWLPVWVCVYLSCTGLYILLPSLYFAIIVDQKRTWNVISWLKVCLKTKRRANDFLITYTWQDFYPWHDLIWALTPCYNYHHTLCTFELCLNDSFIICYITLRSYLQSTDVP